MSLGEIVHRKQAQGFSDKTHRLTVRAVCSAGIYWLSGCGHSVRETDSFQKTTETQREEKINLY